MREAQAQQVLARVRVAVLAALAERREALGQEPPVLSLQRLMHAQSVQWTKNKPLSMRARDGRTSTRFVSGLSRKRYSAR